MNLKFTIRRCHGFFFRYLEMTIQKIYIKIRLHEIAACYTIQLSFQKQNKTSKPFRQHLNVKKYTEKVDIRSKHKNSSKTKMKWKGQKTKYNFQ